MNLQAAKSAGELSEALLFARDLFLPPFEEQWAHLCSSEFRAAWSALAGRLDLQADPSLPASAAEFEAAFIAAFDVGTPHPPVPLIESHYNKKEPLPRILHENILFYQSFGLRLRETSNESADHLRHQLEFVGHLYGMEAGELRGRNDPEILAQIRAGRREFLERHLLTWLPQAAEKAAKIPVPWIGDIVLMAFRLVLLASQETGCRAEPQDAADARDQRPDPAPSSADQRPDRSRSNARDQRPGSPQSADGGNR